MSSPQCLPGGLQSKRSPASVLQGPTSKSTTGLGNSTSSSAAGGGTFVCTCKLCVLLNLCRGSVFLISALSPLSFFFLIFTPTVLAIVGSLAVFVVGLLGLGKLSFSHSSEMLGIGASFSLRTRRKARFDDLSACLISPPSSIGSASALARFLGF